MRANLKIRPSCGVAIFCLEKGSALGYYRDKSGAVNSVGECYLHTVEVTGSNPVPPTIKTKGLRGLP